MEDNLSAIEQIHNDVFEFLLEKHFEEKKKGEDFFFRTRVRFSSGKEKYWLLGNEEYILVSFWTGYDKKLKAPDIHFKISINGAITLFFIDKDTNNKDKLLTDIEVSIPGLYSTDSSYIDSTYPSYPLETNIPYRKIWMKEYTPQQDGEYFKWLLKFIETDKKKIDAYLDKYLLDNFIKNTSTNNNNLDETDELEYSETYPRKLTEEEFYKMLAGVLNRKNETPDYFFNEINRSYNGMFVSIKSFEVRNYRGIEHLKIDGIPVDTKWIVLTGENGFGKSSVLQSIAIGLCGNTDGSYQLLDDNGFVMMEAKRNNERFLNLSFSFNTKNFFNSIKENVAVYGATRLNIGNDSNRPDSGSILYNLFFPNGSLINIENELKESNVYNPEKFNLLKNAFCKLIPDLDNIVIDTPNKNPVVKYIERKSKEYVTFENLASGFRNIIAVTGDIITKLSKEANSLQDLASLKGVVIIDEIELHLHPKYQKNLPKILTEIFPNILFIVSTHSPIPLLGMPKETVLLHVNRTKEKGITIERLDVDFSNLLPNALLSSPIFDFQEIIPASNGSGKNIRTEADYDDVLFNKVLEKKVEEIKNKYKKG